MNASTTASQQVRVWDAPVRVFHWLMVLSFAGAYITAESERWRLVHVTLGYTMIGLVLFRFVWGFTGSHYARFREFVRGPRAIFAYLHSIQQRRPQHFLGHNPLGAVAVVLLLALTLVVTISGWTNYNEIGGEWLEDLHEGAANFMLAVVGAHIVGVIVSSRLHRENLVKAMVTGYKRTSAAETNERAASDPSTPSIPARRSLAIALVVLVVGFWFIQWTGLDATYEANVNAAAVKQNKTDKHDRGRRDHD